MLDEFSVGLFAGFMAPFFGVSILLLCVRFIFKEGRNAGFIFGLGITFSQIIWACVAAALMFNSQHFPLWIERWTDFFASILLLYLAFVFLKNKSLPENTPKAQCSSKLKIFFLGFLLSFAFPQRLLLYLGVFGGFNISYTLETWPILIPLIVGVAVAGVIWWFIFSFGMSKTLSKQAEKKMLLFSKVGAVVLLVLALFMLYSFFTIG